MIIGQNQYDFLRLANGLYNQAHLRRGKAAAALCVADGGQRVHEAGVKPHPTLELLPCRFWSDGRAIHLGQFHTSIFLYPKLFHASEFYAKIRISGQTGTVCRVTTWQNVWQSAHNM